MLLVLIVRQTKFNEITIFPDLGSKVDQKTTHAYDRNTLLRIRDSPLSQLKARLHIPLRMRVPIALDIETTFKPELTITSE